MKQGLWLANSSLLLMFAVVLSIYGMILQQPPAWKTPRPLSPSETEKKSLEPTPLKTWEKIYLDDIFGTYVAEVQKPIKQSFISPIPEIKPAVIPAAPEIKKQEFIPPLTITLSGIIASGDELNNVAMIADETNKEEMYRLGEKVKDGQIIKIAHDRVVLLRANGQQEIYYLRKDDLNNLQNTPDKWKYIVRKIDDQHYEVDSTNFTQEIETLGNLISRLGVVGVAYQAGKPFGIRVGVATSNNIASALGIMENDIITTVNGLQVAEIKNRIKAYDLVTNLAPDASITLGLYRADKDITLSYKLAKLGRPRKQGFPGVTLGAGAQKPPEDAMKMNRQQQREQTAREFSKIHPNENKHQQAMLDIRRRILENLHNRLNAPVIN